MKSSNRMVEAEEGWETIDVAEEVPQDMMDGYAVPMAVEASVPPPPGNSQGKEVQLKMSTMRDVSDPNNSLLCKIEMIPKDSLTRPGVHVITTIDTSGSMGSEAIVQMQGGVKESSGLSVLDIVTHSVRVILSTLRDDDRISIVEYNDAARVVLSKQRCTESGKQFVLKELEKLTPTGCTNLWDGLRQSLDLAREVSEEEDGQLSTVFLLTDGMPNVEPPRGYVPALNHYLEKNGRLPCAIHTFGFGYNLNTELLREYARIGGGMYSFIPDAGMVGTVFIHAIANCLSAVGQDGTLSLEFINGAELLEVDNIFLKCFDTKLNGHMLQIRLGSIQMGQTRSLLLKLKVPSMMDGPYVEASFTCMGPRRKVIRDDVLVGDNVGTILNGPEEADVKFHQARQMLMETVNMIVLDPEVASGYPARCKPRLETLEFAVSETAKTLKKVGGQDAILGDLKGQVMEAISKMEYYLKWGKHYLPSLLNAHMWQACNNFKDPGVQPYARGALFSKLRDFAEDQFAKLPAPRPSRRPQAAPVQNMVGLYLNRCNPCFSGECLVKLSDGSEKRVDEIQRGDSIFPHNAKVLCVLKTVMVNDDFTEMVCFPDSGLTITPYHPVRIDNKWHFPCDLQSVSLQRVDAIYSFVLDHGHYMVINGTECVTLGHNFTDDKVVAHPFFGSDIIVHELMHSFPKQCNEDGLIQIQDGAMIRDPATNLITAIDKTKVI